MEKIKKIEPTQTDGVQSADEVTPEAEEAGFHDFPDNKKASFGFPKIGGGVGKVFLGFGIFILILLLAIAIPGYSVYKTAKKLQSSASAFKSAAQIQDLNAMKTSLSQVKTDLNSFDGSLKLLSWTQVVPYLGNYWKDANHASKGGLAGAEAGEIIIKTIEPYSDILGFGAKNQQDGMKTAEDRISFIVETIYSIVPQLEQISQKTSVMADNFNQIDPNRYPEEIKGQKVRSLLKEGLVLVNELNQFVTGGKPVLEQAPYLLGIDGERTYLLLFQNDKELRPTGGFLTAFSVVKVKKGKFEPVASNDIYHLDSKLNSRIPAPDPIKKYLANVPYWYIRDMNLSPDFKVSMDTFKVNYDKTKSPVVDGIIAVDTKIAVDILNVIGKIGVPGFGNFSAEDDTRCNCPNVIYELESYADVAGPVVFASDLGGKIVFKPPHSDNRKLILGPLMNSLLANAMGQPKEKLPPLFEAGFNAMREKHVLFYFGEGEVQKAMESCYFGGRVEHYKRDYIENNYKKN